MSSSKKVQNARSRKAKPGDGDQDRQILIRNIKARRRALGLNLHDASVRCGMDAQYLETLENGRKRNPGLETLTKVRIGLETTLAWLFTPHDGKGGGDDGA